MALLSYRKYSLARGVQKVKTKTGLVLSTLVLAVGSGGGLSLALLGSTHAQTPNWNLNGTYTFDFELSGSHYVHDATISGQDNSGNFTVNGGYPAGASPYADAWNGTGNVSGNAVTLSVNYTVGAPGTHMDMTGSVASNGSLSGTWTDNYGGSRSGTWTSASGSASSTNQVIVTPAFQQGWSTAHTRPGGAVNFVADNTAPGNPHVGALQLTTTNDPAAKAQYLHAANVPLSNVDELAYSTKQNSASFAGADASYQLPVCLGGVPGGTCAGFTTFVYEPYENGTVTPGVWQSWNVVVGQMWSSRTATGGATCNVTAGSGGAPFYTLAALKTACPDAVVVGFGVNIGSNNPSYDVEADLVDFNGTLYNFEPSVTDTVSVPAITSPANNSAVTSAQLTKIDWTDSTATYGPVTYQYRAYSDPTYSTLVYDSGNTLTASEIPTPGTPDGTYYVQVRAFDAYGISSAWSNDASNPYKITVRELVSPANADQCKNNGWKTFNNPTFKNQGDCVSWVQHNVNGNGTPANNR